MVLLGTLLDGDIYFKSKAMAYFTFLPAEPMSYLAHSVIDIHGSFVAEGRCGLPPAYEESNRGQHFGRHNSVPINACMCQITLSAVLSMYIQNTVSYLLKHFTKDPCELTKGHCGK